MWSSKGAALAGLDRDEEALDAFDHAVNLAPEWVWGWESRWSMLAKLKRYDAALDAFDHAVFQ